MSFKIYFDTAPIIYFLENSPNYAVKIQEFILKVSSQGGKFMTSTLTNTEYLAKPMRENDFKKMRGYETFKTMLGVAAIPVDEEISLEAAKIRAKYEGLKTVDSIHLATGKCCECDVFLTNDRQLKQVSEVNVVLLDELQTN